MQMQLSLGIDNLDSSLLMAENLMKKAQAKKSKKIKSSSKSKKTSSSKSKKSLSTSSAHSKKSTLGASSTHSKTSKKVQIEMEADNFSTVSALTNQSGHSRGPTPSVVSVTSTESPTGSPKSVKSTTRSTLFQQCMLVDQTWEHIKSIPNYKEFVGEQIVLRMMEIDPKKTARQDLGITSLRSARFDAVCQTLLIVVDVLVSLVGPDMEDFEEELSEIGRQCQSEGISITLLGQAIGGALQLALKENQPNDDFVMKEEHVEAWTAVFASAEDQMSMEFAA